MWRYKRTKCGRQYAYHRILSWANSHKVLHSRQVTSNVLHIRQVRNKVSHIRQVTKVPSPLPFQWPPPPEILGAFTIYQHLLGEARKLFWKVLECHKQWEKKAAKMVSWSTTGYIIQMLRKFINFLLKSDPPQELPASMNRQRHQSASQARNTLQTYVPWHLPLLRTNQCSNPVHWTPYIVLKSVNFSPSPWPPI